MAPKRKLSAKQKALFELLKKKSGTELEQATILNATGWKPTALARLLQQRALCAKQTMTAFASSINTPNVRQQRDTDG